MKLSTRGIYAIEALVYLALQPQNTYTSLRSIAVNRKLPVKYLEQIFALLKDAGILHSTRGKQGGYAFARHPGSITVDEILQLLNTTLAMPSGDLDSTVHRVYRDLYHEIQLVLQHYTIEALADACRRIFHQDFVI